MNLCTATGNWFRRVVRGAWSRSTDSAALDATFGWLHGYRFRNRHLLARALTHKSAINPETTSWLESNERLEFLGDAVLDCLVTEHLYRTYPQKSEGQLSKMKSLIVSRTILGEIALSMDLGSHLTLGVSESKGEGRTRNSVLANAFEAVLGALYLDGGARAARTFLKRHLYGRIEEFVNDDKHVNYKSRILEMSQRDGFGIPRYEVLATSGPEHKKHFTVRVCIAGVPLGEGTGSNKKTAQQQAAHHALSAYDREDILLTINRERNHELLPE